MCDKRPLCDSNVEHNCHVNIRSDRHSKTDSNDKGGYNFPVDQSFLVAHADGSSMYHIPFGKSSLQPVHSCVILRGFTDVKP